MNRNTFIAIFAWIIFYPFRCTGIGEPRQLIILGADGGYGNILIAIDEAVSEDRGIITNLQTHWTKASEFLLQATKNEMYFANITILVPTSWTADASWVTPTDESVDKARIIVSEASVQWGDVPYTLQPGLCGEEGEYIHLTPEYLTNIATQPTVKPGKRLVREFAHLKWGLFDEDVPITENNPEYFYLQGSRFLPTSCIEEGFYGLWREGSVNGAGCTPTNTGTLSPACQFFPTNPRNSIASIMYAERFDSVVEFCSSMDGLDEAPSEVKHNRNARNRQNRLCNKRSAWDVLRTLPDFNSNHSAIRNGINPPPPTFIVMQVSNTTVMAGDCPQDIVCLSLDVSGSMASYDRITRMNIAMRKYIQLYLSEDSLVGIVSFNGTARTLAPMTQITTSSVRNDLELEVPSIAQGGTSIGAGLGQCLELLREHAENKTGNVRIMLLSDGKENTNPHVSDIQPSITQLGIVVDTIAYSFGADPVLYSLSEATGGVSFFSSDNNSQNLDTALVNTVQRRCKDQSVSLLASERFQLIDDSVTNYIHIDNTIGLNTTFALSYTTDIDVSFTTDQSDQNVLIVKDSSLKLITAVIVGQVNGLISYTVTNKNTSTLEDVVITITSNPANGIRPIRVTSQLSDRNIQFTNETQLKAYVAIFQGLTSITDLTVKAIIETANGQDEIQYNDLGNGVDSTPNDGVYSAAFFAHQFTGNGFYSINIEITGEGFTSPMTNKRRKKRQTSGSLGNVTRTNSGGLLIVNNWVQVADSTPPEQIQDLRVVGATNNGMEIYTLRWTAPGNDLNIGNVSSYKFSVSNDSSLTNLKSLPADALLTDVSSLLVAAGSFVEIQINADKINSSYLGLDDSETVTTFYFRIRAVDDATPPNQADWSNPVSASIIDPALLAALTGTTDETTNTTIPEMVTTKTNELTVTLGLSMGLLTSLALGLGIGTVAVTLCKAKHGKDEKLLRRDFGLREVKTISDPRFVSALYHQPPHQYQRLKKPKYQRYPTRDYPAYINQAYY